MKFHFLLNYKIIYKIFKEIMMIQRILELYTKRRYYYTSNSKMILIKLDGFYNTYFYKYKILYVTYLLKIINN